MEKFNYENFARLFKGLAHPLRVQIVAGLMQKEECNVSAMVEKLGASQPTVSQHINSLKNAGIIEGFRKGNQICYKVINEDIIKMFSVF